MTATITVDSFTILLGLLGIGILTGIGSAVGNIIAQRYIKPHIAPDHKEE